MDAINSDGGELQYTRDGESLGEFDYAQKSGWMYSVNGAFPNYGASDCTVQDGDSIRWLYTCDLGSDLS